MKKIVSILKKELIETLRDKKSIVMMLIIPLFIPLVTIGISMIFNNELNKSTNEYNNIGINYQLSDIEKNIAKELNINFIYAKEDKLSKLYKNKKIDLYIVKNNSVYTMNGNNTEKTIYAKSLATEYFEYYKSYLQQSYLSENGINSADVLNIITLEEKISEEENYYKDYIMSYAFLFIMMAITVSATYPATDATAGEKERGTLETLLTFPVKARDIILGKFLSVSISSVITGVVSLFLSIISFKIVNSKLEIYKDVSLSISFQNIVICVITIITYSMLISGLCIAVASKCKTFKEAQSSLTPLTFISFFPGMIAFMTNIKSSLVLSIIPFINYSLIFTDISTGTVKLQNVLLMLISTFIVMIAVFTVIIRQYKSEKVLFSN